jgi:hypothetical protein
MMNGADPIDSDSNLVRPSDGAEIIRKLVSCSENRAQCTDIARRLKGRKDVHPRVSRKEDRPWDPQSHWIEEGGGRFNYC